MRVASDSYPTRRGRGDGGGPAWGRRTTVPGCARACGRPHSCVLHLAPGPTWPLVAVVRMCGSRAGVYRFIYIDHCDHGLIMDCTPFLLDALTPTPSLPSRHNAAGGRGTAAHTSRQDWTGHCTLDRRGGHETVPGYQRLCSPHSLSNSTLVRLRLAGSCQGGARWFAIAQYSPSRPLARRATTGPEAPGHFTPTHAAASSHTSLSRALSTPR